MGKRSTFERRPRDFYPTPPEAVKPLMEHLPYATMFIEPCCGDGALIRALCAGGKGEGGHSLHASFDIDPKFGDVRDATSARYDVDGADCFITNPPWSRDVLHPIIENLSRQLPTWLLFDADWMHTRQSAPYMPWLRQIVSVGRVKWIPDSPYTGKDNCCWYLFEQRMGGEAIFHGRVAA